MAWLEENRMMVISDYHSAFLMRFGRDEISALNLHGLRKRMGWKTGRTGCFEKGQAPMNKGVPCAPGKGGRHPNARKTQFKKGNISHTYRGPGHERVDSKDGYVVMILDEVNPWTGGITRPVHKHVYLWEQINGPVPDGHCLKCVDGNKTNTDPSNWTLIPRGVLPRLNGGRATRVMAYDSAPAELKPAVLAIARIDHAIHEKRKSATA
ncbi:HNH endonuclease [Devosia sp. SL43]|uniref:HNH endonuclease n=1 Tax=Devosia sp. SL43 TaxID=2806348 RepID=UPI001F253124|nr:HNH endonuclease [Devosia sp. SL43]